MFLCNWITVSFTINVKSIEYSAREARATDVETESKIRFIWCRFRCTSTRAHVFRSFLSTHSGAQLYHYVLLCYRYGGNAAPYTPVNGAYAIIKKNSATEATLIFNENLQ